MNSDIPNREFTIPYAISRVKEAIVRTSGVHNGSPLLYSSTDSNDMLGMYKYTALIGELATGLSNGTIWINLQESESQTKITVSGVVSGNNALGANKLAQLQDYVLKLITQELQGTFDSQAELEKNSGCLGIVVLIIVSSIMMYII